jgi:hypothetical protein
MNGRAALTVEVPVPPKVVISTEKLAQLTSSRIVIEMLRNGEIEAGQKRSPGHGRSQRRTKEDPPTDAEVAEAQAELARSASGFEELIKGATK